MKRKILALLLAVLAVLLCACGKREGADQATQATQDPVYQALAADCVNLRGDGEIVEAVARIEAHIQQNPGEQKYIDLLTEYQGYLMEDAAAYADNAQYRQAILLMDSAWKQLGYQACYDAAAQYRKEFGIHNSRYIAAGKYNTIMIQGTSVQVCGDEEYDEQDANAWSNAITVSAGDRHVVALRADGTVMAAGDNKYGECDVEHWNNIAAVYAGDCHTVGLKEDGTIVAVGFDDRDQCKVDRIVSAAGDRKVVSVAAGLRHTLALLEDGTVAVCGNPWSERATEVEGWTDIAAIYAGSDFSAGLKTDGTVVVCGSDITGEKNLNWTWDLSQWTDMVTLAAGDYFLVGLCADGTVLHTGGFETDQNAKDHEVMHQWKDIVHISAGRNHTVAVTKSGKVVCAGSNGSGQCDFTGRMIQYP